MKVPPRGDLDSMDDLGYEQLKSDPVGVLAIGMRVRRVSSDVILLFEKLYYPRFKFFSFRK